MELRQVEGNQPDRKGSGWIGVEEWESILETLHWLSQPGILESISQSEADVAAGRTYGEDEIRAAYQVPPRPR
jgi:hypothetical protein